MLGVLVLLAGSLPWSVLLAPLNLRVSPEVPWAFVPMAAYLWVYWSFVGGRTGRGDSAATRRAALRARALPPDIWGAAIVTGLVGFAAVLSLTAVMARLVALPEPGQITTPPEMPAWTAVALLTMASAVAGITEEAAFRGYMQGPIERRYGIGPAIVVSGVMFGLLHFPNHPDGVVQMIPYYLAVAAVYSGITWAVDSILPAVVLHVGGDIWSLVRLWAIGRAEYQRSGTAPALVWDTGLDASFLSAVALSAVFALAAFGLCRALHRRVITRASAVAAESADQPLRR
jgi:membrane protease YdiL (CAAX protease family)